ncbi:2-dehydro-3-deoxygalactonokinase [Marinomonas posidonica]|uniref:2-dehydro-3-deoxygalactonokinase n=1 Tax=Marinomonas posidonica (strain CECT 7376 / NCIMB 14433 / IVIA-Po-181) TaxID=491952 RepID=F6CRW1_MARPP|nr:2-dehydro-3-deoxygalactonokinase [Marinomonas posidonica]AEF54964.1 2-dehydro-3-deoxygalactonokinase [Marinomonas posidonica IVIA-Po-181]
MTSVNSVSPLSKPSTNFIAVDWGTTNLRAFLMNQQGQIQAQRSSDKGMLKLSSDEFEKVLADLLDDWLESGLPIYMAGMVGSRGGWQEVPYQACPMPLDELANHLYWLTTSLPNQIAIVPGLQSQGVAGMADVMRGEETQLLGALDWLESQNLSREERVFCLPGTHCKWVQIEQGQVTGFSTAITGELFARLDDESSLVKGLPHTDELQVQAFQRGLKASRQAGGILHQLFSARSRYVCGELAAHEVRDYLSGIVIGHDVNDTLSALPNKVKSILIIGSKALTERYQMALSEHDLNVDFMEAGEASIRGLKRLANLTSNTPNLAEGK